MSVAGWKHAHEKIVPTLIKAITQEKFGRKNSKKPTQVVSGDKGEDVVATASATRQTTAYLKKLFSEVGFSIDTKKGRTFLLI